MEISCAIIVIQVAVDLASMVMGNAIRCATEAAIAGALFFYMISSPVCAVFEKGPLRKSPLKELKKLQCGR
jgi:hypothetical protein